MANIKSQIKRIRTNEKRRLRNQSVKSELKTLVRKTREAVEAGDIDQTRYEDYLQLLKQVKERKDKRYG